VWPLAGRIFDVRQAKRVFGLIGGGNWLANILLGGLVVAPLLAWTGVADLYLFAAVAVVAAGLVLWVIFRGGLVPAAALQAPAPAGHAGRREKPPASPFKNPYNRLIFAYVLLWWVSFYFIDNIFYDLAGAMYPDGSQLAVFIGRQLSVIGIIALITGMLLTGRIARRFGVKTALLVMPVIVIFCTLVLALGGLLKTPPDFLFWVAAVGKTLNVGLGFSLSFAMGTLLYQPILGSERNRTQTTAEGIVQPLAIGLAGALLLLFHTVLHFSAIGLSEAFLVIGAVWVWVIVRLSHEYPRVLGEALVKRSLGENTALLFDPAGIAQLRAGLNSPHAGAVLYALNQLQQLEPEVWPGTLRSALPGLLAHPAPEVRSFVLASIRSTGFADVAPLVRNCLASESDPQVYAAGVRCLAAFGGDGEEVNEALQSPQRVLRQEAIVGLLSSGVRDKVQRAAAMLDQLAGSVHAEDRLLAAHALADAHLPGAESIVTRLMRDDVLEVRQAAVRAAGRQGDAELWKAVVAACGSPEAARVAEQVLISNGSAALPVVIEALRQSDPARPAAGTANLLLVLGRAGDEQAIRALERWMDCKYVEVRLQALQSLSACGYRVQPKNRLFGRVNSEIEQAAWLIAAKEVAAAAGMSGDLQAFSEALEAELGDARRRVLLLMSFGGDADSILRAARVLDEADGNAPAFAVEAVDASLPAQWKRLVLPLLENLTPQERLVAWRAAGVHVPALSFEAVIATMISSGAEGRVSRWTWLCALHLAGARKMGACRPALAALSTAPDAAVAKLSCWSLAHMDDAIAVQGDAAMLSLVEKVLALKAASLFRQTPDAVLADVAERVEDVSFGAGETVFEKGDRGDSLYIIVSGRVHVRDGTRLLNELGEGAIFGELALLEPAPRSATVVAVEPAHLLRLDESHFRIVMAERPEVAAAIIPVLTGYIRSLLARSPEAPGPSVGDMLEA
jgi:MFS family permease